MEKPSLPVRRREDVTLLNEDKLDLMFIETKRKSVPFSKDLSSRALNLNRRKMD